MSVHQLGGRGHNNNARIRGRSRSNDHQLRHSDRMREGAKNVRDARSEKSAESSRETRRTSDRFDRSTRPSRSDRHSSAGTTVIIQNNYYYDSDGTKNRLDSVSETNRDEAVDGYHTKARSHRHYWDRMVRSPEEQTDVPTTDPSATDETSDTGTVEDVPEKESAQLSRRHSRRLNRISRQVDRMVAHGFGDRAVGRVERQLERVESRIESGRIDSDQGKLYADSLRSILTKLNDRLAPVDEATPVEGHDVEQVKPDDPLELEAKEAYNNLTGKTQKFIRDIHAHLQRIESNGDTDFAIEAVNSRVAWATTMGERGHMPAEKSANLVKTLNYLGSMLANPQRAEANPEAGTATNPSTESPKTSLKVDWEKWSEGQTVPSETPMRDLPPTFRRWIHNVRKSAMKALKSGDPEKAQATVQKSLDWVSERMESGDIVSKHAANYKSTLEKLMSRISRVDAPAVPSAGANPVGSPTYTGDSKAVTDAPAVPSAGANPIESPTYTGDPIRVIDARAQHRLQMYSYASRQYGMAS